MEFAFTEEQEELRAVVRAFLAQRSRSEQVRAGFAPATWAQLIEQMELTAVALSEEVGGAGASFVEVGVALEETGRALLPAPYLPTVVGASALAGSPGLQERVVGGAVVALALDAREPARPVATARAEADGFALDGTIPHVLDGALAQLLVVSATIAGEPALFVVDASADGVSVAPQPTLDGTRGQATVTLAAARAQRLSAPGEGAAALERLAGVLWVALAIEAVGSADRCLSMTVDYLKERVQFGRVLGTFQALRHRCADLAAELEGARATAHYAAWAVDGAPQELAVVAPLANAVCTQTLLRVAGETIQLHGGIGFTWEHDAHLYFKRAKASELLYGTPLELRRLAAERSGILEPAVA
ncbi:MAG TPA: acyl-CoA dehydrogenase family protein [Conexibacter sp.]|nr:acyl-CoA dehydrogenase family protein [Conexibacter sp.]